MQSATVPQNIGEDISEAPLYSSGPEGLGYTLWRFDGEKWLIKKDCPADGAKASPPPTIKGEFAGQLRATSCILAS